LVAIDVETTGLAVERDRVYEIAMVSIDPPGRVIEKYETLIRPVGYELSERLASNLSEAPVFSEVAGDIVERLRRGTVVGHVATFDLSMLDAELHRLGSGLPEVPYLCTNELALGLHVDSPNRRLGMLCHVLGVEMSAWHTAIGDAEATGRLLEQLLEMAENRGLRQRWQTPQRFVGSAVEWPLLPTGGRVLIRDPVAFPPIGDQPGDVDPLEAHDTTFRTSVVLPIVLPEGLAERIREATRLLVAREGRSAAESGDESDGEFDAWDDFEAGQFVGEEGVRRLRRILAAFVKDGDDEAWQVALQLAQLLRYEPGHSDEETARAFEEAMVTAMRVDTDERADAQSEVLDAWADFLTMHQDVDGLVGLIEWAASDKALRDALAPAGLVHRMRTAGQFDMVCRSAEKLSRALGAAGASEEAANVCAEWAQALADDATTAEALAVCERSWSSGWDSRTLANRHSLLLERQRDWRTALEVCDRGLRIAPGDDQIIRRRTRCLKKLT
jgi:DNA polymerase III epsilon subunit-like protein